MLLFESWARLSFHIWFVEEYIFLLERFMYCGLNFSLKISWLILCVGSFKTKGGYTNNRKEELLGEENKHAFGSPSTVLLPSILKSTLLQQLNFVWSEIDDKGPSSNINMESCQNMMSFCASFNIWSGCSNKTEHGKVDR